MADGVFISKTWNPSLAVDAAVLPPHHPERPAGLRMYFTRDLRPVRSVNDWMVDIAARGSLDTANTYGALVARFATFLDARFGADLLGPDVSADGDSFLRAYSGLLTSGSSTEGPLKQGVTRGTVGSHRSALMSFYTFCVSTKRINGMPFTLRVAQTRRGPVSTLAHLNGGRIADPDRDGIPEPQLDRLHRVGLLGLLPSGEPDPAFRGYGTAQRNAAGFGLGVGMGLRHAEILRTTIFEVPEPHPDGLTPVRVAAPIAKLGRGRKVVALSAWLDLVHEYIHGDRLMIARRASWEPENPLRVDVENTNQHQVTLSDIHGSVGTYRWGAVSKEQRERLVIPGYGSPLVLLDHSKRNGAPLTDDDSLNDAFRLAGDRCRQHWPHLDWGFTTHSLRHTFAHLLSAYLADAGTTARDFEEQFGRRPAWTGLVEHQDQTRIVMNSLGHSSPVTTNGYRKDAFWRLLLSVNADPARNPAAREPDL